MLSPPAKKSITIYIFMSSDILKFDRSFLKCFTYCYDDITCFDHKKNDYKSLHTIFHEALKSFYFFFCYFILFLYLGLLTQESKLKAFYFIFNFSSFLIKIIL